MQMKLVKKNLKEYVASIAIMMNKSYVKLS
jgi:hypothetical protein